MAVKAFSSFRKLATISFVLLAAVVGNARAGDVVIEVSDLEHSSGQLRIAFFDSDRTFLVPDAMSIGIRLKISQLSSRSPVVITLHGVAPGRYAVSAYHDEDGDGKRGADLFGRPTEGYGFSNGARGRLGPPDFAAAAIEVGGGTVRVPIRLSY